MALSNTIHKTPVSGQIVCTSEFRKLPKSELFGRSQGCSDFGRYTALLTDNSHVSFKQKNINVFKSNIILYLPKYLKEIEINKDPAEGLFYPYSETICISLTLTTFNIINIILSLKRRLVC